jgi:hypothetical protein
MRTLDAIAQLGAFVERRMLPSTNEMSREPIALTKAVATVLERFGTLPPRPPPDVLAALRRKLIARHAEGALGKLDDREWALAPHVLWDGHPRPVDLSGMLDELLRRMKSGTARTLLANRVARNFIFAYLQRFDAEDRAIAQIGRAIADSLGLPYTRSLQTWRERHQVFGLFDPGVAPEGLARPMLAAPATSDEVLAKAGLQGILVEGGLALAARRAFLDRMRTSLAEPRWKEKMQLEELLAAVDGWGPVQASPLRAVIADALLCPWQTQEPTADQRSLIQEFIYRRLGDPRLSGHRWSGVSTAALVVIRRWLARATLHEFFDLIDQLDLRLTWQHRKDFWLAYVNHNLVDDAWLVLGSRARRDAKIVLGRSDGYGELSGAQPTQSVLLLRMDTLTFCVWTSNGRFRAWESDDPSAPKLFQDRYASGSLRLGSLQIDPRLLTPGLVQFNGAQGYWQDKLADFIVRRTGRLVPRREYAPHVR